MVGHLLNYHNAFIKMKELIKNGKIGGKTFGEVGGNGDAKMRSRWKRRLILSFVLVVFIPVFFGQGAD